MRKRLPAALVEIGEAYLRAEDVSGTTAARQAYGLYRNWTEMLWGMLLVHVHFTAKDPYETSDEMRESVVSTRVMRIFSGGNEHPLLTPESNLRGRAVHDLLAHVVCGCPFTGTGEYNAFEAQAALYPIECRSLLFTEIVGQTCAYLVNDEVHAEQKVCFLDEHYEEVALSLRRQFKKGLTLAGAIEAGLVRPEIVKTALSTGYSARYPYAVLETQKKADPEASTMTNPKRKLAQELPRWAQWL